MKLSRRGWAQAGLLFLLILTLYPTQARGQGGTSNVQWVASDGGGVETGGHVTVKGLPPNMIFGGTYTVSFNFVVEWFDWGSNIRPQSIEWYAKAGCLEETYGICIRNSQNITLGSSTIKGSFSKNQTFSITATLSLKDRPSVNGTAAALGIRIAALVDCLDSSLCAPVGATNPAQKFTFLRPESSVSFTLFSHGKVSVNVINNPGFENGVNPASGLPVGWGNWTKHGPPDSTISVDPTTMHSGNYSAKLDIGQTLIGFIALAQNLPSSLTFRNLTDSPSGLDMWFYYLPKYAGAGDFRIRVLFGENVGELDYVFDPDSRLGYPNSTDTATVYNGTCACFVPLPSGAKNIFLYGYPAGQWHHITRNLRSDWAAPLEITNSSGTFFVRGFSLDIPFPRIQFDIMAFQDTDNGNYLAETVWLDDFNVYIDSEPPANLPPVASFSIPSLCAVTGHPVIFDARSSYDPDGAITGYQWDFGDGTQLSETDPFTNHTYPARGTYRITLTVTDSSAPPLNASVSHDITISDCGGPVVAVFTYSSNPSAGQPVTFNATATGGVLPYSFSWNFGDSSTGTRNPTMHTYSHEGVFVVTLTVMDANGVQVSTWQTINVLSTNLSPVANFTFSPATPHSGQVVSFDGSSSYDPDGNITSWEWSFGDIFCFPQPCFPGQTGPFVQHTYSGPGNFTVTLTVTDNLGARTTTSEIIHALPPFDHDVSVETIEVNPRTAIQGQQVGILLGLRNRGAQNETVRLVVLWDTTPITDRTIVLRPQFNDPFGGLVFVPWDTENVPPGNHTISATLYLDPDQNPSNNALTDGTVTVLPPPTITLAPTIGALGTTVTVTGSGFPLPQYNSPVQVFISFDDQFLGFAATRNGTFTFTFNVPHSEPGTHRVRALDTNSLVRASADFQVLQAPAIPRLVVTVKTGTIYFPGDTATIYVHATINGAPVTPEGFTLQITIREPDGTTELLNTTIIEAGRYRASFQLPASAIIGTYAIIATANQPGTQSSSALATFEVKPAWITQQAPTIAGATAALAGIALVSVAWRKGYLRRKNDGESESSI